MRGDLCPYDHGMDPVVLEDVSVLPGFPQSDNGTAGNNLFFYLIGFFSISDSLSFTT